jgi:hypothetical protein
MNLAESLSHWCSGWLCAYHHGVQLYFGDNALFRQRLYLYWCGGLHTIVVVYNVFWYQLLVHSAVIPGNRS